MEEKLSAKQKKKIEDLKRRKTRSRVSKFRENKKSENSKIIQFYLDDSDKAILDDYKSIKGQTIAEVFKELIRSILNRRLKDLS
jgi:hypothetical protein